MLARIKRKFNESKTEDKKELGLFMVLYHTEQTAKWLELLHDEGMECSAPVELMVLDLIKKIELEAKEHEDVSKM